MFKTDFEQVEKSVLQKAGSYVGLKEEALLTSEEDFQKIFEALPETKIWVEFGSGHGRGPLMHSYLYPERSSIGIEFDPSRIAASLKFKTDYNIANVTFLEADLMTCDIPVGDTYFFYFPTGIVLDRILHELKKMNHSFRIVAIESHGDFLPRLKKEDWLEAIKEIPLKDLRHYPHALVFGPKKVQTKKSLHDISFQDKVLILRNEDDSVWLGESLGLEWDKEDLYQLQIPPRSFRESQVISVVDKKELSGPELMAFKLRRLGKLKFISNSAKKEGLIRKILVKPSFKLELSTGEQLEWSEVTQIFYQSVLCFDSSSGYFYCPPAV